MGERIRKADNKSEVKSQNPKSAIQKGHRSRSMVSPVEHILFLQRTMGNHAVQRLMKSGSLQARLRIGQPGDFYEQEADRVAEHVMRMPDAQVPKGSPNSDIAIQRQCPGCKERLNEDEEKLLQTKEAPGHSPEIMPDLEEQLNDLRRGGQPLPENVRAFYEPRFGSDFSQVRVHDDTKAAEVARALDARAFTEGQDIVFGQGQYAPWGMSGQMLMAHELAHVLQQSGQTRLIQKKNGSEKKPTKDVKSVYLNWMNEFWDDKTKNFNLEKRISIFIRLTGEHRSYFCDHARRTTGVLDLNQLKAAYASFSSGTGDVLTKELSTNPDEGVKIWGNIENIYYNDLKTYTKLKSFKRQVEVKLFDAYAARAKSSLKEKVPDKSAGLKNISKIRQTITDHRQDFYDAVYGGVILWNMPVFPPDNLLTIVSNGGAIAGGVGSIFTIFTGTALVPIGGALIGVGVVASIYNLFATMEKEMENFQQIVLERKIKRIIIEGYNKEIELIKAKVDLLALLITDKALRNGIDLDRIPQDELRDFVWKELFKEFPQDISAGQDVVLEKMNALNRYFNPS